MCFLLFIHMCVIIEFEKYQYVYAIFIYVFNVLTFKRKISARVPR